MVLWRGKGVGTGHPKLEEGRSLRKAGVNWGRTGESKVVEFSQMDELQLSRYISEAN